jgi:fructose/tagatose bisphosphate aldolase
MTKTVNDLNFISATHQGGAEQTTLTEQTLMKKMKKKMKKNKTLEKLMQHGVNCISDEVAAEIEADLEPYFEALGVEGGLCDNCIVAYDRGHERGGERMYDEGVNIGLERALKAIKVVVNKINITDKTENAMFKQCINEIVTSLKSEYDYELYYGRKNIEEFRKQGIDYRKLEIDIFDIWDSHQSQ